MLIQGPGEPFVDEIEYFWGHQWIPHRKRVQISYINFYFELFLDPFTNDMLDPSVSENTNTAICILKCDPLQKWPVGFF